MILDICYQYDQMVLMNEIIGIECYQMESNDKSNPLLTLLYWKFDLNSNKSIK